MATFVIDNGKIITPASTTAASSMNIPEGTAPTSPNEGDIWTETTPNLSAFIGGRRVRIPFSIYSQVTNVTVANTVTETTVINTTGAAGSVVIPAAYWSVGRTFNMEIWGFASQAAANTITLRSKIGGTTILTNTITEAGITNQIVYQRFILTCITLGAGGTIRVQGVLSVGGVGVANQTANTADITLNTTVSNSFDASVQHSLAAVANTVTVTNVQIKN